MSHPVITISPESSVSLWRLRHHAVARAQADAFIAIAATQGVHHSRVDLVRADAELAHWIGECQCAAVEHTNT